jgi:hypothetical protein
MKKAAKRTTTRKATKVKSLAAARVASVRGGAEAKK